MLGIGLLPGLALAEPGIVATRDAATVAQALDVGGIVTAAAFDTIPPQGDPAAVSDGGITDFPTDGSTFAILSSGNAAFADDENLASNTTAFNGLGPVRGDTDFDATVLHLTLNVPAGTAEAPTNCLTIDFRFFSEEFPEFKNTQYNDAFIAELDPNPDDVTTSDDPWRTSGSTIIAPDNFAFDEDGNEVSINALGEARATAGNAEGTTYDGGTASLVASTPTTSGTHHLYLSIFDQGDAALDSAVFLDGLRAGHAAPGGCVAGARRQISGITIQPTGEQTSSPTGVVATALGNIPLTGVSQHEAQTSPGTAPFGKAPFGKAPFGKAPFGKAPFGKAPFGKAPFGKAPFGKAPFGKAPFGKAPFGKAPLAEYPILRTGGWEAILGQTCSFTFATPQSVTWQQLWSEVTTCASVPPPLDPSSPETLRLDEILVGASPLADLPLLAFLMGRASWNSVGRTSGTWGGELGQIDGCTTVDPTLSIAEGVAEGCDLGVTTLPTRTIGDLTTPAATAFWDLTISELNIKQSFLGDVALASIPTTTRANVVDCSHAAVDCSTGTLRDVANSVTDADPEGAWAVDAANEATGTFAHLGAAISGASLSDLVIAFLDPTATPIEGTPLSEFRFERLPSGNPTNLVTYEVQLEVRCTESAGLNVHATLPPTFTYRPGSSSYSVGSAAFSSLPDPTGAAERSWTVPPGGGTLCPAGQVGEVPVRVRFAAMPGFELGSFAPTAGAETTTISRVNAPAESRTPLDVVESLEPAGADSPATASPVSRNSVVFSHLTAADDIDYFAFDVPVGESLEVSLSHLTRDYQLVLYAPDGSSQEQSLRPSTTPFELPVGVEPQVDPTGTNPGVLPPPALQDIPFSPGSVLSGISDFRGTDPEYLSATGIAGTGGDTTWVAQVSGANGAFGPEEYALTIRSSAPVQLPPTPARTFPNALASPTAGLSAIAPAVDTLILYDHRRTAAAYGAAAAAEIEAAIQDLVTEGQNLTPPIEALVVPTDTAATDAAFDAWDARPSSPDRMNDVVRAINDEVDSLKTATNLNLAGVKNVVIVGEGDLIPHAAIVDGTADGNEIGFVGETIFGGQSNHLTGAFATKHYLSDAPYGTIVPLSLKGQLLYLPQAAVGRLFGGPDEIVGAIDRFLASGGVADARPATTEPRTAFESDYDFFVDGGAVIANALRQQVGPGGFRRLTTTSTATWDRADFADEVDGTAAGTGVAPDILSPNGHFDQYRMLPAAGAATNDESDVYTTADLPSGLAPTIFASKADLNGDGTVDATDDANAFYGDTSIIDGGLDCDAWSVANDGAAGDGAIGTADDCTLVGYDGSANGITIGVVDGAFATADGTAIADGARLPRVFNATDPDDRSIVASDFAWSIIGGRIDANGDGTIDGDDCHVDLVGTADVLANTAASDNPCGFATPPDPADNGKVDLNGDGQITGADTCEGCLFGEDVENGTINSHLAGRIFFSIGCHFGLNYPGSLAGATAGDRRLLDWQEALAERGTAVTIGNFGYGIGDTATVGFQEVILGTLAENLDGSMSVGAGLQDAVRDYMASTPSITPYDLKIMQELAIGGLPMYGVPDAGTTSAASVTDPVDHPTGISGVDGRKFTVTSSFTPTSAPGGRTFFSNAGQTQATHPYPIVPKETGEVPTIDGKVAHGAFPLSWDPIDEEVINSSDAPNGYAFANATYDGSTIEGVPIEDAPAARTIFPTAFGNVGTWYETDGTPRQQLVVLTGQFRSNETGDPAFGTFRKYPEGEWVVTYASESVTDFVQPRFSRVTVLTTGTIEAAVDDEAGVAQVFAQVLSGSTYSKVDLSFDAGSGTWRATGVPGPIDEVTLFAIDVNGNVGTANNGGPGFVAVPPEPPDVDLTLAGNQIGDIFVEPVTVTVSPADYKVKIDDGAAVDDPVVVSGDGEHTATVYEPNGTTATGVTATFTIDTGEPAITITRPAFADPIPMYMLDGPSYTGAPVLSAFTCSDGPNGTGIASCVDLLGRPSGEPLDRSTLGVKTFTVIARDGSGHLTTKSHQYRVVGFEGFFDPIKNPPTVNSARAGTIVPVKWRLTDENGVGIADPISFVSVTAARESGVTCDGADPTIEEFAGSSGLQYLGDGFWQFNWKTKKTYKGKCFEMSLNLYDGTASGHSAATAHFTFT